MKTQPMDRHRLRKYVARILFAVTATVATVGVGSDAHASMGVERGIGKGIGKDAVFAAAASKHGGSGLIKLPPAHPGVPELIERYPGRKFPGINIDRRPGHGPDILPGFKGKPGRRPGNGPDIFPGFKGKPGHRLESGPGHEGNVAPRTNGSSFAKK